MALKSRNPWGRKGGLDAQRADLWLLDLNQASGNGNTLISTLKSYFPAQMDGISSDELPYTAYAVTLPELRIEPATMYRSSTPYTIPAADGVVGEVRVNFRVTSDTSSATYTILELWKELARVGRQGYYYTGTPIKTSGGANRYTVPFRFDVPLQFYRGVDITKLVYTTNATFHSSDDLGNTASDGRRIQSLEDLQTAFASTEGALDPAASYILKSCWCKAILMSELSHDTAGTTINIVAALQPEYIVDAKKMIGTN